MSTYPNAPSTLAIGQAIVSFAQALIYSNSSLIYTQVALGEIKDLTDLIAGSGTACLEVYANLDNSQHKGFGGKVSDEQTWFLLSIVSLDNAGSVYHSQIRQGGGKFLKIFRNGAWYRAHLIEIMTRQEYFVITPPGVIS